MSPRRITWIVLLFAALLAACEKSGGSKGSGALAPADVELFKNIPAGGSVVFGGNYMKLQDFMSNSALGKFTEKSVATMGKGMKEWMSCFMDLKNLRLGGSATIEKRGAEIRMAFSGADIAQISDCAKKAGFETTADPDGKFVAIEVPMGGKSMKQGYLKLPSGVLYTRQGLAMGGGAPSVTPGTRADLESDVANLSKGTAADDKKLQAVLAKVDRTKTMWFAGTAAGTPVADKIGEAYGAIEISPGIAVDITVEMKDSALADKVESAVKQAKDMADQLPADLRPVLDDLDVRRDGAFVRFSAKISDSQLGALTKMMGGMGGMLGR